MPPTVYRLQVKGQLGAEWSEWFDGMAITPAENGNTLLSGPVPDQPALHALLVRVRDLGLTLVSLDCIETKQQPTEEA
jgi:hypothetical protein